MQNMTPQFNRAIDQNDFDAIRRLLAENLLDISSDRKYWVLVDAVHEKKYQLAKVLLEAGVPALTSIIEKETGSKGYYNLLKPLLKRSYPDNKFNEDKVECIILLLQDPTIQFANNDSDSLQNLIINLLEIDLEKASIILNLLFQNSSFNLEIFFKDDYFFRALNKNKLNILLYCLNHKSFTFNSTYSNDLIDLLEYIKKPDEAIEFLNALLAHPNFNQEVFRAQIGNLFKKSLRKELLNLAEFYLNQTCSDEIFKQIDFSQSASDFGQNTYCIYIFIIYECPSTELGDTFLPLFIKKFPNPSSSFLKDFLKDIVDSYVRLDRCPDIVFEIVKHPNFDRAKNAAIYPGSREPANNHSALFWAAKNGYSNIVLVFLNDEKVSEDAKDRAIEMAIKLGHTKILAMWALEKYWPVYQCFLAAKINPESSLHLFAMLDAGFWDCVMHIGQTYIHLQSSPSSFFAVKKEKEDEKTMIQIFNSAITAIQRYLTGEKMGSSETDYGVRRAKTFYYIFENKNLTLKDKMLALCALFREENGKILKSYLRTYDSLSFKPDIPNSQEFIVNAAEKYARVLGLDLTLFQENLIDFIENRDNDISCFKEVSSEKFRDMIINPQQKSCLMQ